MNSHNILRLVLFILSSLMVLSLACTPDASEPNDTTTNATPVTNGNKYNSLTICINDTDIFTIDQTATNSIEFRFRFNKAFNADGTTEVPVTDDMLRNGLSLSVSEEKDGSPVKIDDSTSVVESNGEFHDLRIRVYTKNIPRKLYAELSAPNLPSLTLDSLSYELDVIDITDTTPTCSGTETTAVTLDTNGNYNSKLPICESTATTRVTFDVTSVPFNGDLSVTSSGPIKISYQVLNSGGDVVAQGATGGVRLAIETAGTYTVAITQSYPLYNGDVTLRISKDAPVTVACPGTPSCSNHGTCDSTTGVCTCYQNWKGDACQDASCDPPCNSEHGTCQGSDTTVPFCDCQDGWQGNDCSTATPVGSCPNNCSSNGVCNIANNIGTCTCNGDWTGDDCSIAAVCPGSPQCSGHGSCELQNDKKVCVCTEGWSGADCSQGQCTPACSANGVCQTTGVTPFCQCNEGWQGPTCTTAVPKDECPSLCSGHGTCDTSGATPTCVCDPDWTGTDCSQIKTCPGTPVCSSNGNCTTSVTGDKVCKCAPGWQGVDCSVGYCSPTCSGNGFCQTVGVAIPYCSCYTGWEGQTCARKVPTGECSDDCSGHGTCVSGVCKCTGDWTGFNCAQAIVCPGTTSQCSGHGTCSRSANNTKSCQCDAGWRGDDCSIGYCDGCQHGTCVTVDVGTPYCECSPGWQGDQCATSTGAGLCANDCSGNGVCTSSANMSVCVCLDGWKGFDCSLTSKCPGDTPCSSRGTCINNKDNTKSCLCYSPYSGVDCSGSGSENQLKSSSGDGKGAPLGAIIGGAAGGGALLLCLTIILSVFLVKRREKSNKDFEMGGKSTENPPNPHGHQPSSHASIMSNSTVPPLIAVHADHPTHSSYTSEVSQKSTMSRRGMPPRPLPPPPTSGSESNSRNHSIRSHANGSQAHSGESLLIPYGSRGSTPGVTPGATPLEKLPFFGVSATYDSEHEGVKRKKVKGYEIDYNELEFLKEVGKGAFGVVYKAKWRETVVAVKQLRNSDITGRRLEEFRAEAEILKNLRPHPNVVLFMGITAPPHPVSIVTEYCAGGSLYSKINDPKIVFDYKSHLAILYGISKGILHLHSEDIIHRDLAARNILLTSNWEVKVTDFGMSRENTESETNFTRSDVGPLKWMAPESIINKTYSIKTDVWSFGIVIWELLTRQEPYPNLDSVGAAVKIISEGLRLPIPPNCPPVFAGIMKSCWEENPDARPTFREICTILAKEIDAEELRTSSPLPSYSKTPKNLSGEILPSYATTNGNHYDYHHDASQNNSQNSYKFSPVADASFSATGRSQKSENYPSEFAVGRHPSSPRLR